MPRAQMTLENTIARAAKDTKEMGKTARVRFFFIHSFFASKLDEFPYTVKRNLKRCIKLRASVNEMTRVATLRMQSAPKLMERRCACARKDLYDNWQTRTI